MAAAHRRLLLAGVALCLLALSPSAAAARPCHTLLVSFASSDSSNPRPFPLTTVVAVFRVRRLGPRHHHGLHHLHSVPADIQIRRPQPLPAVSSLQERAKDILVVVVGLLFGVGCGALTAASMYLVWSLLAGAAASSRYDELDGDEDYEDVEESPKKAGYVTIPDTEAYGKN